MRRLLDRTLLTVVHRDGPAWPAALRARLTAALGYAVAPASVRHALDQLRAVGLISPVPGARGRSRYDLADLRRTPGAYAAWTAGRYSQGRMALGDCNAATQAMAKAFPELRRVRGHCSGFEHWWCVAPDGRVVDPTASQFGAALAPLIYVELDETRKQPVGYCANYGCRQPVYRRAKALYQGCCDEGCRQEALAEQADAELEARTTYDLRFL